MHTARRAGPSITYSGEDEIAFGRNLGEQLRTRVAREALFLVAADRAEREPFGEDRRDAVFELPAVPFCVVQNTDAQSAQTHRTFGKMKSRCIDRAAWIVDHRKVLSKDGTCRLRISRPRSARFRRRAAKRGSSCDPIRG